MNGLCDSRGLAPQASTKAQVTRRTTEARSGPYTTTLLAPQGPPKTFCGGPVRHSADHRGWPLAEPRNVLQPHVQAQPLEPQRVTPHAAPVHRPVCTNLRHQLGADQGDVQDVTAPPRRGEPHPLGASRRQMFPDLPGHLRAQRDRPAHRTQSARGVVAAKDEERPAGGLRLDGSAGVAADAGGGQDAGGDIAVRALVPSRL